VQGKVGIVSGGGSGHEPLHGGFVGPGMLDAAVPGAVFTSPTPDPILAATKAVDGGAGVLHIVKNYTGDVLNFETAAELAEADGIRVKAVVTNDDVAVKDSLYTAGRRGVAGTVLLEKIVGAAAEQGADLDELVRIGTKVNDVTRTMGVALTACTPPAKGSPLFELGGDEMEVGVGIHGEPGRERRKLASADEIADLLLEAVVSDLPYRSGDRVALMINGLGGTPISELYILFRRAHQQLQARGITVGRSYVNEYCTSLDMAGASLTLVRLDDEIERLLAAPAEAAIRVF
jgi:dihydroxyacetone kinase-like protein